jgi:hypothetical protein
VRFNCELDPLLEATSPERSYWLGTVDLLDPAELMAQGKL